MPTATSGPIAALALAELWHGMVAIEQVPISVCQTDSKVRHLPHDGTNELLQNGCRLVLLPKLAFFALWNGTGDAFRVPRAKPAPTRLRCAMAAASQIQLCLSTLLRLRVLHLVLVRDVRSASSVPLATLDSARRPPMRRLSPCSIGRVKVGWYFFQSMCNVPCWIVSVIKT